MTEQEDTDISAEAKAEFDEKFDAAFDAVDEDDSYEADDAGDDDNEDAEVDDTEDNSDDVDDADSDDEEGDDDSLDEKSEVDIEPELMRAAEWAGLADEAKELYKQDPEKAMAMLKKVHSKQNELTRQYSEAGRQRYEAAKQQAAGKTSPPNVPDIPVIDWDKIRKKCEEEGLDDEQINEIIEPQKAAFDAATTRATMAEQAASQYAAKQTRQAVLQQVTDFFASDSLKPYRKMYGEKFDVNNITPKQQEIIDQVVMIRAGYSATTGREMPLADALAQAHSLVSSDYLAQAEREKLKGSVKKRRNGATQKPTHGRKGGVIKDKLGMPQEFHDKFSKAFRNS
jgi:hypothetical protein